MRVSSGLQVIRNTTHQGGVTKTMIVMNILTILITLFSLFSSLTGALECYKCENCGAESGDIESCSIVNQPASEKCGKFINASGVVSRRCTNNLECTARNVYTNECVSGIKKDCFNCCSTDLCNAATPSVVTASSTKKGREEEEEEEKRRKKRKSRRRRSSKKKDRYEGNNGQTGPLKCYKCDNCEQNTGNTVTCVATAKCGKFISSSGGK
ncbi:uncharacterized protein LOC117116136 [Anneissia japonica]|uniref:uncharacterized protein LOC117116136 n=1 Tax=Anneissia japonica TaxID=1529436 RepID=UPI0014258644|nr:uncharacterized protein LOC117116136 [Anneissia japonica]